MTKKQELSSEQNIASNPQENIWVQANAGTGKTSVLVHRLLRILFRLDQSNKNSGILCLTYTNAGAGEMRNRILGALRKWAMADDEFLEDLLNGVSTNNPITKSDLSNARNIFYQYIDSPDILKIKTIHGFCEEILHRFPIEAGISPSWSLVSDANQKILLNEAFHHLINSSNFESPEEEMRIKNAFEHIITRVSEHSFDELLGALTARYKQFFKVDNFYSYREYFIDKTMNFLNLNTVKKPIKDDNITKNLQNILKIAKTEEKPGKYIQNIIELTEQYIDNAINFETYKNAYLTASDTKIVNVSKKDYLNEEQDRVYEINQYLLNEQIFKDTISLFDLSAAFAKTYKGIKSSKNLLDFDDLILYTRKLFSDTGTMGWVLSQLDLSLGHILVDEAQDTSPEQWEIMRLLAGDFFTDGDISETPRSLFVVGDTKQSIYGFQGADPNAFATSREEISSQITTNLRSIREIPLVQSFRSTEPILKTVDFFFGNDDIKSLTGFINNDHKCFRKNAVGVVEIYNVFKKEAE